MHVIYIVPSHIFTYVHICILYILHIQSAQSITYLAGSAFKNCPGERPTIHYTLNLLHLEDSAFKKCPGERPSEQSIERLFRPGGAAMVPLRMVPPCQHASC